jgi:hypothetical protein
MYIDHENAVVVVYKENVDVLPPRTAVENYLKFTRPEEIASSTESGPTARTYTQEEFLDATKYFHLHQNKVFAVKYTVIR